MTLDDDPLIKETHVAVAAVVVVVAAAAVVHQTVSIDLVLV